AISWNSWRCCRTTLSRSWGSSSGQSGSVGRPTGALIDLFHHAEGGRKRTPTLKRALHSLHYCTKTPASSRLCKPKLNGSSNSGSHKRSAQMRITREKNTAFADQPKPLASGELSNQVKEKPPSKPLESAESRHTLFVPATGKVELVGGTKTAASQGVQIKIANFKPGEHVFPPSVPVKGFETLGNKSPKLAQALHSDGFLPGHLALRPQPHALPKELERAPRFAALGPGIPRKRGFQATTIFPPDNRR